MCRYPISAMLTALVLLHAPTLVALDFSLEGLPTTYTPGTSFSFNVGLVGAEDLNLYSIDLTMEAESGNPGADFLFDEDLTTEPASRYVFGGAGLHPDGFVASADVDGGLATLNLSDLLDVGEMVDTVSGVNDLVATVTVTTMGDMGDLTIAFDTTFLELLDDFGDDIPGFDNLTVPPPATVTPIPEPSALILWMSGCIGVLIYQYRRRRRQVT